MRFKVVGAHAESGDDIDVVLEASSQKDVEQLAHDKGILVATIQTLEAAHAPAADESAIALIDDEPPAMHPASASGAHTSPDAQHPPAHKHGSITVNANSPSDTVHTAEGHIHVEHKAEAALEYHILMNQALYLLETAVNKYIRDGWEPQGGLTIGVSNNAMQYFQALIRRKKV